MAGDLFTIVYFSHACRVYDDRALLELLDLSRRNNQRDGVTGMLLYHDRNFAQALEGPKVAVERTFARIGKDPSHDGIVSTGLAPIASRQFAEWSMGFVPASRIPDDAKKALSTCLSHSADQSQVDTIAWSLLKGFRGGLLSSS